MSELSHHPAALEELAEAAKYYLVNASRDVALIFDERIDKGTKAIQAHPLRYPVWRRTRARRCVIQKFPYAIFYLEWPGNVRILAIAHTSRRPGYWKSRIAVA